MLISFCLAAICSFFVKIRKFFVDFLELILTEGGFRRFFCFNNFFFRLIFACFFGEDLQDFLVGEVGGLLKFEISFFLLGFDGDEGGYGLVILEVHGLLVIFITDSVR